MADAPLSSVETALQAALDADPDDVATWSAYADYLQEQDHPRGTFMRVQLALEDPHLDRAERRRLQADEDDLLADHGRDFIGRKLAMSIVGRDSTGLNRMREIQFRRGWLNRLSGVELTRPMVQALAAAPTARFLQHLDVRLPDFDAGRPIDPFRKPSVTLLPLATASFVRVLKTLRCPLSYDYLQTGMADPAGVLSLLAEAPNVELLGLGTNTLYGDILQLPLSRLRVIEDILDRPALPSLWGNRSLHSLTTVSVGSPQPGDLTRLAQTGHLSNLTSLELHRIGEHHLRILHDTRLVQRLTTLTMHQLQADPDQLDDFVTALEHEPGRLKFLNVWSAAFDGSAWDKAARRLTALGITGKAENLGVPIQDAPTEDVDEFDDDWE